MPGGRSRRGIAAIVLGILLVVLAFVLISMTIKPFSREGFESKGRYEEPAGILLINLDSRKDRYDHFMKSATTHQIPWEIKRLSAVKGVDVDWKQVVAPDTHAEFETYLKTGKRASHRSLSTGALGCYLSHLEAMKRVVAVGKPMLICEDDLIWRADSAAKIREALSGPVPYDPNTLILFHVICNPVHHVCTPLPQDSTVLDVRNFWSFACYYVTPQVARTILEHALPMKVQIDIHVGDMKQQGKLNIFARPCTDTNGGLGTDIQVPIS